MQIILIGCDHKDKRKIKKKNNYVFRITKFQLQNLRYFFLN